MRMLEVTRRTMWVAAAVAGAAILSASRANAGPGESSILQLFPQRVAQVTYLDLRSARQQPWFDVAERTLLPLRYRKLALFLSTAGLDINSQADALAWAVLPATETHGEEYAIVAKGHFSPSAVEDYFGRIRARKTESHGLRLHELAGGPGAEPLFLVFLDTDTMAFGQRGAIDQLIAVYGQSEENFEQNQDLYPLARDARPESLVWTVWNKEAARAALEPWVSALGRIPLLEALLGRIESMEIDIVSSGSVSAQAEIVSSSPAEATALAALLEAGISVREQESERAGVQMPDGWSEPRVDASGARVEIEILLDPQRVGSILRSGNPLNVLP